MRGFQPQHFADGGLVQGVKRLFGMDEERNARIAAYRAERAQEKAQQAAQAQAQQAQQPAPAKAISDYSGMNAMQRREKAAGLADGGMVRGPGTGTSDDVPDEVPEGTYIMPADSTQALGPDQLAAMGTRGFSPGGKQPGKKVPVNLSNGEFKMPPEQVHAIGVQALDQMKNATHQPVRGFAPKARPEEPRQFFSDGGGVRPYRATGVDDEFMQSMAQSQNARRQQANATASEAMAQSQASSDEAAQQAQAPAAPAIPQIGQMHSAGSRSGGQMLADGLTSGARAFFDSFQKAQEPAAAPSPEVPRGMPGYKTDVQRGGGNVPAIDTAAPTAAPAATAPPAPATTPGPGDVTRVGNSYSGTNVSGDISINGQAPRNGGQVSAQNMAAADGLAARSQQESMARVTAQPAVGFQPAGVTAPTVRHSGNDWQTRNELRNAQVSAGSIMNNGGKWDQHKGVSPERAYAAALEGADIAARTAQPGVDVAAMRENAGIQREGMQQTGATERTGMQEQGANARDAGRTALQRDELGMRKEAAGFQTRAAKRLEDLQASYQSAKTPEERAGIAQQIRDLQGKSSEPNARMEVVRGSVDPATGKREGDYAVIFDPKTQTARAVQVDSAAKAAPPAPTDPSKRVVGQTYAAPNGQQMRWSGTGWTPA